MILLIVSGGGLERLSHGISGVERQDQDAVYIGAGPRFRIVVICGVPLLLELDECERYSVEFAWECLVAFGALCDVGATLFILSCSKVLAMTLRWRSIVQVFTASSMSRWKSA
jgi:hypothetical protein